MILNRERQRMGGGMGGGGVGEKARNDRNKRHNKYIPKECDKKVNKVDFRKL